jgi:hypothetical protein
MTHSPRSNPVPAGDFAAKTSPEKSKMPPFGGAGTIYFSHRDVNKTPDLAGAAEQPCAEGISITAHIAELTRPVSKLGKTRKSIPEDSGDSCHGVSLTLG